MGERRRAPSRRGGGEVGRPGVRRGGAGGCPAAGGRAEEAPGAGGGPARAPAGCLARADAASGGHLRSTLGEGHADVSTVRA